MQTEKKDNSTAIYTQLVLQEAQGQCNTVDRLRTIRVDRATF